MTSHKPAEPSNEEEAAEREWDEVVEASFPASDPPPNPTVIGPPQRPRRRAA